MILAGGFAARWSWRVLVFHLVRAFASWFVIPALYCLSEVFVLIKFSQHSFS